MTETVEDTLAEDESKAGVKNEDQDSDVGRNWYFVDQSIKERLGTGDGPSFSVASLFSRSVTTEELSHVEPKQDDSHSHETQMLKEQGSAPGFFHKRSTLFILDEDDVRLNGIGSFFNVNPHDVAAQDFAKTRRDIKLIVQNKFKRLERNQEKFINSRHEDKGRRKQGRHRFKKRRT